MDRAKSNFGNTNRKKNRILDRLNGIQSSPHYPTSHFLHLLENDIINDYNNLLKIEEDYWKIQFRINWLNDSDANTKFFHLSEVNRRRKNSISFFKYSNGNWINDPAQILNHTYEFFQKAFQTNHIDTPWKDILNSQTCFDNIDLLELDRPLKDFEVTHVIFSFKSFKAPSPDEIHPFFTKNIRMWSEIPFLIFAIISLRIPQS